MAYMNYKEGTGVRARGDLSPNRPTSAGRLSEDELITAAAYLGGACERGESVTLRPAMCGKLADRLLEVVNRRGGAP
jgi:hypothetical protein